MACLSVPRRKVVGERADDLVEKASSPKRWMSLDGTGTHRLIIMRFFINSTAPAWWPVPAVHVCPQLSYTQGRDGQYSVFSRRVGLAPAGQAFGNTKDDLEQGACGSPSLMARAAALLASMSCLQDVEGLVTSLRRRLKSTFGRTTLHLLRRFSSGSPPPHQPYPLQRRTSHCQKQKHETRQSDTHASKQPPQPLQTKRVLCSRIQVWRHAGNQSIVRVLHGTFLC